MIDIESPGLFEGQQAKGRCFSLCNIGSHIAGPTRNVVDGQMNKSKIRGTIAMDPNHQSRRCRACPIDDSIQLCWCHGRPMSPQSFVLSILSLFS